MNQGPNQPPEPPAQSLQDVEQRLLELGRARSLGRLWTEYKRLRSAAPSPWTPAESDYLDRRFQEVARQITGATTPTQLLSYVRIVDELQETPAPSVLLQLDNGIFRAFGPPAPVIRPPQRPPALSTPPATPAAAQAPSQVSEPAAAGPSRKALLIAGGLAVLVLAVIAVVVLAGGGGGGDDDSTAASEQQAASSLQPTTAPQLAAGSGSPSATVQASPPTPTTSSAAEAPTQAPATAAPAAPTTAPAAIAPTNAPTPDIPALIRAAVEGEYSQNLRAGNGSYVFSHLHQSAIAFYGNQACQDFFSHIVADPTFGITVKSVSGPAPWTWQIYGDTVATIPDAYTLDVTLSQNGQTRSVSAHFAWDGAMLRVFSPCRPPPA